jgi:lysozyme family protein
VLDAARSALVSLSLPTSIAWKKRRWALRGSHQVPHTQRAGTASEAYAWEESGQLATLICASIRSLSDWITSGSSFHAPRLMAANPSGTAAWPTNSGTSYWLWIDSALIAAEKNSKRVAPGG